MPRFKQVDVFTKTKYLGNPVAVIYDCDNLTTKEMQKIARWTNLSETTFILTPKSFKSSSSSSLPIADYRVRIFTSNGNELSFAGHPTIGTAFALLEDGKIKPNNQGQIIQECGAGLVKISVDKKAPRSNGSGGGGGDNDDLSVLLSFELPYFKFQEIKHEVIKELQNSWNNVNIIGKPIVIEDGPKWAIFQFESIQQVLDLNVDLKQIERLSLENDWTGIGVFGKYYDNDNDNDNDNDDGEIAIELRNIAPAVGVKEDPACGSGSGAIGVYLANYIMNDNDKDKFTINISQGKSIKRDGKIKVNVERNNKNDLSIHVGGYAITCFQGIYSI
ncbi:phenazine biosynthesis-like protein, putative [Candida dubliniensis CD36]|uniref:Uncharacterized isomerase, putative n=1 Tax=Candida dubliniensis (strain CD36 / ATCC MYA-646 / CBS 7987 / NCPF 3949 / NRRL Y-17841) TaxID=573826 RepID=B9WJ28_CANDC|nr:phenazine biosynthesis-like protein, putative [Candida dubliniensis CD36]CAX41247.1 phenazine biosynthesis-like protein, putative [Candida dubliniensis CD36]